MNKKIVLIAAILCCFIAVCSESKSEEIIDNAPSWKGLTPGESTMDDVMRIMGKPDIEKIKDGKINLYWYVKDWDKRNIRAQNLIVIERNKISTILISDPEDFENDPEKIFEKYGKSEITEPSGYSDSSYFAVYPELGFAFLIDESILREKAIVVIKKIFQPMSAEIYKRTKLTKKVKKFTE